MADQREGNGKVYKRGVDKGHKVAQNFLALAAYHGRFRSRTTSDLGKARREGSRGEEGSIRQDCLWKVRRRPTGCVPDSVLVLLYFGQARTISQHRYGDLDGLLVSPPGSKVPDYGGGARVYRGTYKATNKDLWSMMLEFCRTVKPTLQDYEADGAWPTLLDDFVAWRKPAD
ncbi:hypothetical protein B0H15DRAFT_260359 [Mycena belliarum]|uniref:Defective in cullin neddylation protein n=1 Tax=Mycena belliarum TaxID=1033014 RepID=A0AAD6U7S2_9AGAR|nr:hypothetical protein B0H15DRAFT_260359 [Mycena belliae]